MNSTPNAAVAAVEELLRRLVYKDEDGKYRVGLQDDVDCTEEVCRLQDALLSPTTSVDPWQSIDEAPRDGTPIIACSAGPWPNDYSAGLHPTTVRWRAFHPNQPGKTTWRTQDGRPCYPTHFQPMPEHPSAAPAGGA